ncbi:MAG: type II 3-dehydroquinate dehydratase [Candidatus Omnitrophica bacterium]|nr:type II 3-dehydroquinate dehydratase [Candidatus Omnitrophota bacterium]
MKKILVIHGPNLQLLGHRNPSVYGRMSLSAINERLKVQARRFKAALTVIQSNHEGEIVEAIGKARGRCDGILINPAAYTHTSVAIRDALEAVGLPAVEVHLSNIYARESFRRKSLMSPVVTGQITGFGPESYTLGLNALIGLLTSRRPKR